MKKRREVCQPFPWAPSPIRSECNVTPQHDRKLITKLEPVAKQNEQFHKTTTDMRPATELQKQEKLTVKPPTVMFCLV